jgi:hypothetical protein
MNWFKGFCRSMTFMLSAVYTTLLVHKVQGSDLLYIPVIFLMSACAWYGWSSGVRE